MFRLGEVKDAVIADFRRLASEGRDRAADNGDEGSIMVVADDSVHGQASLRLLDKRSERRGGGTASAGTTASVAISHDDEKRLGHESIHHWRGARNCKSRR